MTHIRDIIEHYLSKEEAEEFAEWAFGEDFRTFNIQYEAHIRWNEKWGHFFPLEGNGDPNKDIPKMIGIWKIWLEWMKTLSKRLQKTDEILKADGLSN